MKFLIIFASITFSALFANAHVPSANYIFKRLAENSGEKNYRIESEVELRSKEGSYRFTEVWNINNIYSMNVSFKGDLNGAIVYTKGQRQFVLGGKTQRQKYSEEFFELVFHNRSRETWSRFLEMTGIAKPSELFVEEVKLEKVREPGKKELTLKTVYTPNSLVRPSRQLGILNLAIGTPSEGGSSQLKPQLWVDQEQFVISKIRFRSGAEVEAKGYQVFAGKFQYPSLKTLRFEDGEASLKTTSVATFEKYEEPKDLSPIDTKDSHILNEYIKRFR
ncbi:MAG: hypothetical protein COT74_05340 [Bdellovibrionales bacterium CG10_big_fil_rev_8_21_14_0_10_45_34]|nr:MAG: hypothetical protein COT74_05340 [Bdellovibrionales bacterium CG10_big_fil_rev_8_21_14_0_10_45_34]